LLMSVTPQRAWYDQLLLWAIPVNQRQAIALTACSWVMWLPHILWGARALGNFMYPWLIVSLYGPALVLVLKTDARTVATDARRSLIASDT